MERSQGAERGLNKKKKKKRKIEEKKEKEEKERGKRKSREANIQAKGPTESMHNGRRIRKMKLSA